MLSEDQINALPERIYERLSRINTEYLESAGKVIKKIGELRPTDVHELQRAYDFGADVDMITKKLSKESGKNIEEIYQIYDVVAKENYDYSKPFYTARGKSFKPYEENNELRSYVKSLARQTVQEYVNITQHTAFAVFGKDGKSIAPLFSKKKDKIATSLSETYTKVIDYAVTKVQLGQESYQSAMREVIRAMSDSGIRTADYATGYSRRLDTAVRQNILWGVKQCNQNTADIIGEDFGADGYEISYHSNPRQNHAEMGGQQYAIGKGRTVKGVYYPSFEQEAEPLLNDYGCLHFKFSILLGVSKPAYSKDELERFKENDKKTFEFEGKTFTGYEGTQLQRKIETSIRHYRDLSKMANAGGDEELKLKADKKIRQLTNKYHQLSRESGLPTRMERLQSAVKGIDTNNISMYNKKALTNNGVSGIISSNNKAVRKQYIEDVSKIKDNIDKNLPIEEQARQAFEARNAARDKARKMMTDKETLEMLEREHPNKTFDELVESKMKRKGMTREEAIQDIYDTSDKTNENVNKELGLDGDD